MATTLQITPIDSEDASTEAPTIALTPAYKWLGQVLYRDQLEDSVYLLTDLNADGHAADAGEHNVFFNGANASGLVNPTTNVFDVFQASNGAVYVAEGDTDSVYRVRDLNGDGDGNDAGEANVWFSAAGNAGAFTMPTPNGVAQGADGAIYFVNAGVGSAPADRVYRTVDLNADGDANDAGEATVFVDLQTLISTSSAFDISFIGNVAYVTDTNGGAPDTVYRLEDQNGDGDASDAGEASIFLSETNSFGAPMDIANAAQGNSLLTYTWIGGEADPPRIYRLTDLNGHDTLFGEGGADRFDFNSVRDSLRGAAHDVIMDFEHGVDVIDLSGIDANSHRRGNQTFTFIDGNFTGKVGQLHVAAKGGDLYRVEGDINGDGKADFKIDVHSAVALDIADFIR